jgi:hypothetical protein
MRIVVCVAENNLFQLGNIAATLSGLTEQGHVVSLARIKAQAPLSLGRKLTLARLLGLMNAARVTAWSMAAGLSAISGLDRFLARPLTMRTVADRVGVPQRVFPSVNGREFLEYVRAQGVDLIVNHHSEIYRTEAIGAARLGVLNIHSGFLPEYRSALPVFWSLFDNTELHGITAHLIDEGVDSGRLVLRRGFAFAGKGFLDVLQGLNAHSAQFVLDAVGLLASGAPERFSPLKRAAYRRFPTWSQVGEFKSLGCGSGRFRLP